VDLYRLRVGVRGPSCATAAVTRATAIRAGDAAIHWPDGGMIEFLLSFFDFFADRLSLRVRGGFFFDIDSGSIDEAFGLLSGRDVVSTPSGRDRNRRRESVADAEYCACCQTYVAVASTR
jgi:hypothetical protein